MDRFSEVGALVGLLGDWSVGDGPLYHKLAATLRRAITDGALAPGTRLPAERPLADALAVSRTTVVTAYDELREAGLADSRRGSGTRVAGLLAARGPVDGRVSGGRAGAIYQRLLDGPGDLISLTCAADAGLPVVATELADLIREDLPDLLAGHGYHPRGLLSLRTSLAKHYSDQGLPTDPEQILVTTGAHQAIALATELYIRPGDTIVVELPSWPGCIDVFRGAGATMVGVPLDDEGIAPEPLEAALREHDPALLYVMPTFHNPTGLLMSAARRRRVAELAARYGVPVIEDNAYAGYSRTEPEPPMATWSPPGAEILTIDSLGKTVWGGLRVGWVRGPAYIVERLARRKVLADLGSPVLDQALAARLVDRLPALRAERSAALTVKHDRLAALLAEHLPTWRWTEPDGGAALWIRLPGVDAGVFGQVAQRHGVEVVPGSAMDPEGGHDDYLRLPFTMSMDHLTEVVARLARAWTELGRHGPVDARPVRAVV